MGSSRTQTQRADPWAPIQPFLLQGAQDAANLYANGGFQINPYSGPMVANYGQMRTNADHMTQQAASDAVGMGNTAAATLTGMMDPNARSAGWDQVVQNTIAGIMPGINSSFAGSGMTGSDLHQQNLAKGLSAGIADVENQAWQQGQNRAMQAAGMMPAIAGMGFNAADALRMAGQDRAQYNQSVINANILRDQQQQAAPMDAIERYMSMMSGIGGQFGTQTGTSSQRTGLLGMLGLGLQAAPLLFSDVRLKADIKRVGTTDDGLPVYTYRYKAGGPVHMGVMAQDVAQVKPDAVHKVGDFLAVDYGAL